MPDFNLDNEYRKINARMQSLFEKYGEDFNLYQREATLISKNFETRIAPNGAIQIKRGKANSGINKFQKKALEKVSEMGGIQTEIKEARQYLKEKGIDKPTQQQIDELVMKKDYVKENRDMISRISKQINQGLALTDSMAELYNRASGRSDELTYEELYDLMKKAEPDFNQYL